ncbi:MAG: hypothetical protein WCV99_09745 [Sterolibacterium sp.]|jgi:MSHA biogenesis protein MshP
MRLAAQHGFSIVAAIFILVVLAALGAFMVTVSTTQAIGSALDIQGSRAYQAARSGIEWGVFRVQSTAAYRFGYTAAGVATSPNSRTCATAAGSFAFPGSATTLSAFTVTVTCTATYDPSPLQTPTPASCDPASGIYVASRCGPTVFQIIATACNQPSGGICPNNTNPNSFYVERRLEVVF